ncbi:Ankyrin repeat, partial [Trinorchestia longiramus]
KRGAFLDARDRKGHTPLHLIALQGKDRTYLETLSLKQVLHALLGGNTADVDAINAEQKTPLDILEANISDAKDSVLICSKILCEYGAHISTKLKFHLALHFKKPQNVKKRGKRSGFSELLHLIFLKDEPSIKRFLKKSGKNHIEDWENRYVGDQLTLYFFIDHCGHEMVQCFLTFGGNPSKMD